MNLAAGRSFGLQDEPGLKIWKIGRLGEYMIACSRGAGRRGCWERTDSAISGASLGALPSVVVEEADKNKLAHELSKRVPSPVGNCSIWASLSERLWEAMMWSLKVWCISTIFATAAVMFPSGIGAGRSPLITMPVSRAYPVGGSEPPSSFFEAGEAGVELSALPAFREAPAYRNGRECASSGRRNHSESVCDENAVHVTMTLDAFYLRGSMAAIFSILKHSECPENVIFHFLVSYRDAELESLVHSTFPFLRFKLYHFDETKVKGRISSSVRSALEQPLNYARNYLADLLEPCVKRVIYLDSDLVVVDDIAKLWSISLGEHSVGAPVYCHANFTKYFTTAFWSDPALASTFDGRSPCYFNTGVMVMDLVKWRRHKYTQIIEAWMEIQKEQKRIYELGSLPPFLLVFAGAVQPIEHRWNQHGLGGDNLHGRCRPLHPGPVSLLHWSGKGKPWLRLDSRTPCPLDSLWAPYDLFFSSIAFS